MLLAIDGGNSVVKFGLFDGPTLVNVWRFPNGQTITDQDCDQIKEQLGAGLDGKNVEAIIVSGLIPSTLIWLEDEFLKLTAILVNHKMKTGLKLLYHDPSELGTDRIADSVAAVEKYGAPCIVVDFGTATTFNAINSDREFLGGMIVSGIKTAFNALSENTGLPRSINFEPPHKLIGSSTYGSLQSGWYYGTIDMVDGLIKRIRTEMGGSPRVIATGGLGSAMEIRCEYVDVYDETLTLDGLRMLYEMNKA